VSSNFSRRSVRTKSGFQALFYFKEAWNPDLAGALTAFFPMGRRARLGKIATDI
jgi:hypothetical protein